jgi:hypothetical protein
MARITQPQLLRVAFAVGAITDALALIPMLSPRMARLMWGFENTGGPYLFAMGYAAALMAAWTGLLLWAYRKPLERSFVAALTVLVIYGLIATEVIAVVGGHVRPGRMIPTWCLQAILLGLFAGAYHFSTLQRWMQPDRAWQRTRA